MAKLGRCRKERKERVGERHCSHMVNISFVMIVKSGLMFSERNLQLVKCILISKNNLFGGFFFRFLVGRWSRGALVETLICIMCSSCRK